MSRAQHVQVSVGPDLRTTVCLGGRDVTAGITGLSFEHGARDGLPALHLNLAVWPVEIEASRAEVKLVMPDGARNLLISLGWTPPAGVDA